MQITLTVCSWTATKLCQLLNFGTSLQHTNFCPTCSSERKQAETASGTPTAHCHCRSFPSESSLRVDFLLLIWRPSFAGANLRGHHLTSSEQHAAEGPCQLGHLLPGTPQRLNAQHRQAHQSACSTTESGGRTARSSSTPGHRGSSNEAEHTASSSRAHTAGVWSLEV